MGFGIEYQEPGGTQWFALSNRLSFAGADAHDASAKSSLLSPIQKFLWVHFPFNAEMPGEFTYRVTPVSMAADDALSYGEAQTVKIALQRETYPGELNVTFTRRVRPQRAQRRRPARGAGQSASGHHRRLR